ncbi:uncharacterized protein LOC129222566 [Uloborus diversus]|uniref:uncharacterized protein LOC129222566 n=1 Tax=Uloborus diversus TaxID=327109 RepID=UPI0024096AE1|nr:uncharacterized protein LOC129222566 [Uloborus diversus]
MEIQPAVSSLVGRIVRTVKDLLRRVLGKASIEYEEMLTILCDVEAVINARSLTYLSEDPQYLVPLTPSMFIQDIRTVGVPDLDHLDTTNLSRRLRYQQRLRNEFRRSFRDEYLGLLVQSPVRNKHLIREIKVGDIVIVKCDNRKRLDWPLGRVIDVFPGQGDFVRVVKLKTEMGELTRPVQELCPMEIAYDDELVKSNKATLEKTVSKILHVPDNDSIETEKDDIKTVPKCVTSRYGRKVVPPKIFDI